MIVSEIGLNHKGDGKRAMNMLKKLVDTSIDAITFQIPKPEFYEKTNECGGPLSKNFYEFAIDFVHRRNKQIGFAIADKSMVSFLDENGADFWKTLSLDASNFDLHNELQKTNKITFLSTGVSDENDIIEISKRLANIRFIHTQLSHNVEDANLRAISRIRDLTSKETAFGLHCSNTQVLYLSLAFNPSDIFFYVKENTDEKYPDDEHAILLSEVDAVARNLRTLESSIGNGIKTKMENRIK